MTEQVPALPRSAPMATGVAQDLLRVVRISEEIRRVVSVAGKINIMALNAIFLAKRAGTSALGFGVLSHELRVFAGELRDAMTALSGSIQSSVGELSQALQRTHHDRLFGRARESASGAAALVRVLAHRTAAAERQRLAIRALRRELKSAMEDATRLAELGRVLAKSAKIEAAYGATFAGALTQVSGEFDAVVEEVCASLERLQHSNFFGRNG